MILAQVAPIADHAKDISLVGLAKLGAGVAIGGGALGSGVGIGIIFGKSIESAARQPEAMPLINRLMFTGFALVEAQALYALLITFLLLAVK
jgi:F-type H+-transporting ATPase subunit c